MDYENQIEHFRATHLQRHELRLPHTVCRVYPILLAAGAALSAAGTGLNIAGNEAAASKMRQVRTAAAAKQKQYQDSANAVFTKSASTASPEAAQTQIDKGTKERSAFYNLIKDAASPAAAPLPATASTGTNGVSDGTPMARAGANQQGRTNAWSNLVTGAQSRLGGYDDLNVNRAIENANAGSELRVISNKAHGQANILPIELDSASHAGDSLSGWGQLVSALGSVAMMGSAAGIGTAGAGAGQATNAASTAARASGFAPIGATATRMAAPIWRTIGPLTY